MFFTRNTAFFASNETLHSVSSTSSTEDLVKKPSARKDFSAALGDLQNQYGFGGSAPSAVPLPRAATLFKFKSKTSKKSAAKAEAQSSSKPEQDYDAAYGTLCTSYGFGGALAPTPSTRSGASQKKEK